MNHREVGIPSVRWLRTEEPGAKRKTPPLQESLRALLSLTRDEIRAAGYALYEFDEAGRALGPRLIQGLAPRRPELDGIPPEGAVLRMRPAGAGSPALLSFALPGIERIAGVLDLGFTRPQPLDERQRLFIGRTVELTSKILRVADERALAARAAKHVADLELELAEQKIVERARGLATQPSTPGRGARLHEHIERILDTPRQVHALAARARECEELLCAREVVTEAKFRLQRALSIPEEDAYVRLRDYSRKTRTPLAQVAREFLTGRIELPGLSSRLTA